MAAGRFAEITDTTYFLSNNPQKPVSSHTLSVRAVEPIEIRFGAFPLGPVEGSAPLGAELCSKLPPPDQAEWTATMVTPHFHIAPPYLHGEWCARI
jgi:hypothetical protein